MVDDGRRCYDARFSRPVVRVDGKFHRSVMSEVESHTVLYVPRFWLCLHVLIIRGMVLFGLSVCALWFVS